MLMKGKGILPKHDLSNRIVIRLSDHRMATLNKICTLADWEDPDLYNMMLEIFPLNPPFHPFHISNFEPYDKPVMHRKIWEWAIGMLALRKLGKLNRNSLALGIGCGSELPSFYLSNIVKYVFCTDLYPVGEKSNWLEANRDMLTHPEKYSPIEFNRRRLGVQVMDGRAIAFEDNTFDIVFSYSSIEHFGSKDEVSRTMQEIYRVLKPGGVASITTEIMVSGNYDQLKGLRDEALASSQNSIMLEIFTPEEVEKYIISTADFRLHNKVDYNVSDSRGIIKFPDEAAKVPHIFLEYKDILWGSLHLAMTKKGSNLEEVWSRLRHWLRSSLRPELPA